ncbi:uncharacterized protein LOC112880352 [Panicum hallii]|uniref:uncharacterized protein LOC112880352 n=1 Tax=Panicum hallii TaxID=206008 RepID=UPI000DF4DF14|nr:uncharacterized protein LOC112880352 [Panicum hallii]
MQRARGPSISISQQQMGKGPDFPSILQPSDPEPPQQQQPRNPAQIQPPSRQDPILLVFIILWYRYCYSSDRKCFYFNFVFQACFTELLGQVGVGWPDSGQSQQHILYLDLSDWLTRFSLH